MKKGMQLLLLHSRSKMQPIWRSFLIVRVMVSRSLNSRDVCCCVLLCAVHTIRLLAFFADLGDGSQGKKRKVSDVPGGEREGKASKSAQASTDLAGEPQAVTPGCILTSLGHLDGAAIHAGGLSQETLEALDLLNDPASSQPRQASDFSVDPLTAGRPVKRRNPDLATVFSGPSEFGMFRHISKYRCSQFESDQLIKMTTKVRNPTFTAVYSVCCIVCWFMTLIDYAAYMGWNQLELLHQGSYGQSSAGTVSIRHCA